MNKELKEGVVLQLFGSIWTEKDTEILGMDQVLSSVVVTRIIV
jgi:hypothetical protein